MGAREHNGSRKKSFLVKRGKQGKIKNVVLLKDNKIPPERSDIFTLKRVYYVNKSSSNVRKIISTVQGKFQVKHMHKFQTNHFGF